MTRQIAIILCLILAVHVSARKTHHKTSHPRYTAGKYATSRKSHKSSKSHKTHKEDLRPVLTIDDVKGQEHLWGIDISHYQTEIDWTELQTEKPNFMFIKASEGADIQDYQYCNYYAEARKIGIPVGSYHFFSYKSSGKDQARNFLAVAQHSAGDLIPVLDAEFTRSTPSDNEKVTAELTDFIEAVYLALGHYPIIYCNHRYVERFLTESIQQKCKLWIVEYKNQPNLDWTLWQKTDKFKLAGIKGHVDLNFFNGDQTGLQQLFYKGKNG